MSFNIPSEGSDSAVNEPWDFILSDDNFDGITETGSTDQDFSLSGASDLALRISLSIWEERAAVALKESLITPPPKKNEAAIQLLQSWLGEDEAEDEHRETFEFLKSALDEDRMSDRKLFVEE